MHPNSAFRGVAPEKSIDLIRDISFGMLSINADNGPLLSHIPFILSEDATSVELHLVRSNPIARALTAPQQAVIAVVGPDGYISPDWYGTPDQVPTWNYVAVHLRGRLELLDQSELQPILARLSAQFESRLLPKTPWTDDKMSEGVMDRMMRQIVPCRMMVDDVQSTWKLGQNKPDAARIGAAEGLQKSGNTSLADLMRNPPD